jgi:hypothetical protein
MAMVLKYPGSFEKISKKCESAGFEGLDDNEKAIYAIWWLETEVNNDGFRQYLWDVAGDHADIALNTLNKIGASKTAGLLSRAIDIAFAGSLPPTREGRQNQLKIDQNTKINELEELDDEFCEYSENFYRLLNNFLAGKNKENASKPSTADPVASTRQKKKRSVKPGIRKRQKEFEEYIVELFFAERDASDFDEAHIRSILEEGLYLNKNIGMLEHRPLWFQVLVYLDEKRNYTIKQLQTWLQELVEHGAEPEKKDELGMSGLQAAAHDSHFNLLKALTESLCPNLENPELCLISLAVPGEGCLHESKNGEDLVTYEEMADIIGYLLDKGHNPHAALLSATEHRHEAIVEQLLEGGADVNYQNPAGVTALMWAFGQPATSASMWPSSNSYGIAKMLLERGADPLLKSNQRRSCRSILASQDSWRDDDKVKLLTLLKQYGG